MVGGRDGGQRYSNLRIILEQNRIEKMIRYLSNTYFQVVTFGYGYYYILSQSLYYIKLVIPLVTPRKIHFRLHKLYDIDQYVRLSLCVDMKIARVAERIEVG